jgi:hypothetical protein
LSNSELYKFGAPDNPARIFGVALQESVPYANAYISVMDENEKSYFYSYIPIIVAQIGVYLEESDKERCGILTEFH